VLSLFIFQNVHCWRHYLDDQDEQTKETAIERRQRRMKEKLERSKLRKKAMFDMEYDDKGDGEKKTYFEEWKTEMDMQAKVSFKSSFNSFYKKKFSGFIVW